MSEGPDRDAGPGEEHDSPETEADGEGADVEASASGEEGDEGEEDAPRKKTEDWEKRAHNAAGQAAREKSRRRAAERRSQELESRIANLETGGGGGGQRGDELLDLIGSLRDDDEDPVGDIASVKRALKLFRQRQLADTQVDEQTRTVERHLNVLRTAMSESEEDFASDHADYFEAAAHYRQSRLDELKEAGYAGRGLERKLADDLFGIVRFAIESGQDPAERVYALAGRRGFKPGGKAADKRLDKLQAAGDASRTVNGGGRPNGALSWGDVTKLDGAARDKAWAKLRERELARSKH